MWRSPSYHIKVVKFNSAINYIEKVAIFVNQFWYAQILPESSVSNAVWDFQNLVHQSGDVKWICGKVYDV